MLWSFMCLFAFYFNVFNWFIFGEKRGSGHNITQNLVPLRSRYF